MVITMKGRTLRGILRYLKPYWFFLVGTVLLAIATVASTLAVPYLAGLAIDCILAKDNVDFARIFEIFIGMGICIGITALSQWLMSLCNNRIAYHVLADIRKDLFDKL